MTIPHPNRTMRTLQGAGHGPRLRGAHAGALLRMAAQWVAIGYLAFCPGLASRARAQVMVMDFTVLDPAMRERVRAALDKIAQSPGDIAAVETLLAVEPRVVKTVWTSESFGSSDPVANQALKWCQSPQPAEVLEVCLEKGSDSAVYWALRQVEWKRHDGGFDKESMARLMPGMQKALEKSAGPTRAQAVRTMLVYLPPSQDLGIFFKGLLKGQPDEVMAVAVEQFANILRRSDPEIEGLVSQWLGTSDNGELLRAACHYWWLVKSRDKPEVKEQDIVAFERLAGHADAKVRSSVALAVEGVATPAQPRLIAALLRLTHDKESLVRWSAVRCLRNANTAEVNARLLEILASGPADLRSAAMEILGLFGKDHLPLLVGAAASDEDQQVRFNAIYALRKIGTPEAGQALEAATHDPDAGIRREAEEQWKWFRLEHPAK